MDCASCGELFNWKDRREFSLPCTHSLCGKCCSHLHTCPECREDFTLSEIRLVETGDENTPPASLSSCRLKTVLGDLLAQRDKVRVQNTAARAAVLKTATIALDQLAKMRDKLIAEIDTAEAANSASFRQLECSLQSQLRDITAAGERSHAVNCLPDLSRPVTFVKYVTQDNFGTELLLCIAALRSAVASSQVQSGGQTARKAAYTNKYVPVTEGGKQTPPTPRDTPRDEPAKWVYEFRGAKKAFTPDFTATLERAYAKKEVRCELRDKQQKVIFEVDLRTMTSYRPGDASCRCVISREA